MSERLRVLTLNILTSRSANGPQRRDLLKRFVPTLDADVVALQEVTRGERDEATEIVGTGYEIIDVPGGHPVHGGECLAVRHPATAVHTLDRHLVSDESGTTWRATAVAVEVVAPGRIGPVLVVHHKGTYELHLEHVREQQALATARFVESLTRRRPHLPVVLLGDFNAGPDAASMRFLTGRQSLDGISVRYEDTWEAVHGDEPGHTFDPGNPLVRAGQMPTERGRRLDHVMVRSGAYGALLDVADCRLVLTEPLDGVWASDHYGVLADLRLPGHPPGQWA